MSQQTVLEANRIKSRYFRRQENFKLSDIQCLKTKFMRFIILNQHFCVTHITKTRRIYIYSLFLDFVMQCLIGHFALEFYLIKK